MTNVFFYHLKVLTVIGRNKETWKEKKGLIFLCIDEEAYHEKAFWLFDGDKDRKHSLTEQELQEAKDKLGIFAVFVTRDMDKPNILLAYCIRQTIEQLFDYAKK